MLAMYLFPMPRFALFLVDGDFLQYSEPVLAVFYDLSIGG